MQLNKRNDSNLVVILGPTASGKTSLGVNLAEYIGGEIISADSRQVYRGMDIGTGKDLIEYGTIAYHLIDIVDPGYEFNLFEFQDRFIHAFNDILSHNRMPILVGGTGLYLDAVLRGYRLLDVPVNNQLRSELGNLSIEVLRERLQSSVTLHNTTDTLDKERLVRAIEIAEFQPSHHVEPFPEIRSVVFGLKWDRQLLRERISRRLKERLDQGLVEEVERLLSEGISYETLEYYGLEYRYIARFIRGELNRNDMFQKLQSVIHEFAKKQETWFRRMERNGIKINWLDADRDPLGKALEILGYKTMSTPVTLLADC